MALSPLDRAVAVGLAAFSVLCPERSLAEVADARNLSQQQRALFDEDVVLASSHVRLRLFPITGNRHRSETMAFLNISQTGRAPPVTGLIFVLVRAVREGSLVRGGRSA